MPTAEAGWSGPPSAGIPIATGRAWVVGLTASLSLVGTACSPSPSHDADDSDARDRREALHRQLERAEQELGPWDDWFRNLEEKGGWAHAGPGRMRAANADRSMYDPWVTRLHPETEAGTVDEHGAARGERQPIGPFETLVNVAAQLRELGIDFLVLPVPPVSAVYPRRMAGGAPPGDSTPPFLDWRLRAFYLALEEEGIEVVDLLPALLDPPPPPEMPGLGPVPEARPAPDGLSTTSVDLLFRLQDRHWTAVGADVAAGVLAERIRRFPWFPEVRQAMGRGVIVDRWEWVRERGPIARRLVRRGALPDDYPAEIFLRRQTRIEGERWSFEDRDSPILLLGDSFAGPGYAFRDGLLAELGFRLDAITLPGGRATGQLEALRLRGARAEDGHPLEGKRLVVWEFTAAALNPWYRWRPAALSSSGP